MPTDPADVMRMRSAPPAWRTKLSPAAPTLTVSSLVVFESLKLTKPDTEEVLSKLATVADMLDLTVSLLPAVVVPIPTLPLSSNVTDAVAAPLL